MKKQAENKKIIIIKNERNEFDEHNEAIRIETYEQTENV